MRNTEKHCSVNTKVKVEKAIKFNQIKILVLFQNKFNLVITIKIIDLVEVYSLCQSNLIFLFKKKGRKIFTKLP